MKSNDENKGAKVRQELQNLYERYLKGDRNFGNLDVLLDSASGSSEGTFSHLLAEIPDVGFFNHVVNSASTIIVADALQYDLENKKGETPLDIAIKHNSVSLIPQLHKLSGYSRGMYGITYPLHLACSLDNKEAVAILLNYYDSKQKNAENKTPLDMTKNQGIQDLIIDFEERKNIEQVKKNFNDEIARKLSAKDYVSLQSFLLLPRSIRLFKEFSPKQKYDFFNALITTNQLQVLNNILETTQLMNQINMIINVGGDTLLHAAVLARNYEAVKFFCNHGLKIDTTNLQGITPLDLARDLNLEKTDTQLEKIIYFMHNRKIKGTIRKIGEKREEQKHPGSIKTVPINESLKMIHQESGVDFRSSASIKKISLYKNYPTTPDSFFKFKENWQKRSTNENLSKDEVEKINEALAKKEAQLKHSKAQALENSLKRLYNTLTHSVEYQLIHITPQVIEGLSLLSSTKADEKKVNKKTTLESNKFWRNKDFVFTYLLPKGSPLPALLPAAELHAYIFDAKKALKYCEILLKSSDPYFTERATQPFEGMQFDNVFTGLVVINKGKRKGERVKNYFTVDINNHRRNYPIRETDDVLSGNQVFNSLALDVIEMIRRVAEADIDAALKLLDIFSDDANQNPSESLTSQQIALASKLYRASNLREVNVHSELPFVAPNTGESLLNEVVIYKNRNIDERVNLFYQHIIDNNLVALTSMLQDNSSLLPTSFPYESNLPSDIKIYQDNDLINISTSLGTPLCHAIRHHHLDVVKLLLAYKADVNAKDKPSLIDIGYYGGEDPLMVAVRANALEIVKFLVDHGANLGAVTQQYNSIANALSIAKESGHHEIYHYLLSRGARNPDGSVPGKPLKDRAVFIMEQQILCILQVLTRASNTQLESKLIEFNYDPNRQMVNLKFNLGSDVRGSNNLQYDAVRMVLQALGIKNRQDYEGTRQAYDYDTIEFALGTSSYALSHTGKTSQVTGKKFDSLEQMLAALIKIELNLMIASQCYGKPELDKKPALRPLCTASSYTARATPYLNSHDGILKELGCSEIIIKLSNGQIQISGIDDQNTKLIYSFLNSMLNDQNPKEYLYLSSYTKPLKIIANADKFINAIQKSSVNYLGIILRVKETGEIILFKRWHPGWESSKQVVGYTSPGGTAPFPHNLDESVLLTLQWKLGIPRSEILPFIDEMHFIHQNKDLVIVELPISLEMAKKLAADHYSIDTLFYHPTDVKIVSLDIIKSGKLHIANPEQFDKLPESGNEYKV